MDTSTPVLQRAIGAALHRAGDATGGLRLGLTTMASDRVGLDDVMAELPSQGLLLRLTHDRGSAGILFLDTAMVASLVEIQTAGSVRASEPSARTTTTTDAILCEGFVNTLLRLVSQTASEGAGGAWMTGYRVAGRLSNARSVAITLPDEVLQRMDLTIDVEGGQRNGRMLLVAPSLGAPGADKVAHGAAPSWSDALAMRVVGAPTTLTAVMTRKSMSLVEAEALRPGDIITLPREVLGDAMLCGPDGRVVLRGRLGQMNGQRAFRVVLPQDVTPAPTPQDQAAPAKATSPVGPPEPMPVPVPEPPAAGTPPEVGVQTAADVPPGQAGTRDEVAQAEADA